MDFFNTLITYIFADTKTFYLTSVGGYFFIEIILALKNLRSTTRLVDDLKNENDYLWQFFYETPHYFNEFFSNEIIVYEIWLSRGLYRRINQFYPDQRKITPYDVRTYDINFNKNLLEVHDITYSYPVYLETFINLKQKTLFYELHAIFLRSALEKNPQYLDWFRFPNYIWQPPIPGSSQYVYWSQAEECILSSSLVTNNWSDINIYIYVFIYLIIIYFFLIFTVKQKL